MADGTAPRPSRRHRTICPPIPEDAYQRVVHDPRAFRATIDECFRRAPELFPDHFARGYELKDDRVSTKQGLPIRRILVKDGSAYSIRPWSRRVMEGGDEHGRSRSSAVGRPTPGARLKRVDPVRRLPGASRRPALPGSRARRRRGDRPPRALAGRARARLTLADIAGAALDIARSRARTESLTLRTLAVNLEAEPLPAGPGGRVTVPEARHETTNPSHRSSRRWIMMRHRRGPGARPGLFPAATRGGD